MRAASWRKRLQDPEYFSTYLENQLTGLNVTQNKPEAAAQLGLSQADLARLIEVQLKTALEEFRDGNDRDFMATGNMVSVVTHPNTSEDSAIFLAIAAEFGVTTAARWSQYRANGFGRAWLQGLDLQATAAGAPLSESQRAKVVTTVSEEYRRTRARTTGQDLGYVAPQTASEQLAALEYAATISAIDQQQLVQLVSGFLSEPQMEIVRQRAKQVADMYAAPIERLRNDPSSFRRPTPDSNGC